MRIHCFKTNVLLENVKEKFRKKKINVEELTSN